MEDMRKQLQCQACKKPMFPPILMCQKGESVCQECRSNNSKCPLCQKKFTDNRNHALETLAKLPCFTCNKCNAPLKLIELREHYAQCLHSVNPDSISCPIEKCKWQGAPRELPNHWRSKKLALHPYVEDNICRSKLNTYSYFANMVEAYDSVFFFKSMSSEGKLYWALQYVGAKSQAEQYSYEIEIFNPTRPECKFVLTSYCQSIDLANTDLFKESVCICMPKELLQPYLIGDEELFLYNLRVKEVNAAEVAKLRNKAEKLLAKYAKK